MFVLRYRVHILVYTFVSFVKIGRRRGHADYVTDVLAILIYGSRDMNNCASRLERCAHAGVGLLLLVNKGFCHRPIHQLLSLFLESLEVYRVSCREVQCGQHTYHAASEKNTIRSKLGTRMTRNSLLILKHLKLPAYHGSPSVFRPVRVGRVCLFVPVRCDWKVCKVFSYVNNEREIVQNPIGTIQRDKIEMKISKQRVPSVTNLQTLDIC